MFFFIAFVKSCNLVIGFVLSTNTGTLWVFYELG